MTNIYLVEYCYGDIGIGSHSYVIKAFADETAAGVFVLDCEKEKSSRMGMTEIQRDATKAVFCEENQWPNPDSEFSIQTIELE